MNKIESALQRTRDTTNLSIEQLKEKYKDGFGRLIDRFKTYNVIPLGGESRR